MYYSPKVQRIKEIRQKLIDVAQDEYDNWEQDEDGYNDEYGTGGICHLIADRMIDVLHKEFTSHNKEIFAVSKTLSDVQHVNVLIALDDGIYELDLPYQRYETGGGFQWKKIDDVIFDENDITLDKLDHDLKNAYLYLEDNESVAYEEDDDENDCKDYIKSVILHEKKTEHQFYNNTF